MIVVGNVTLVAVVVVCTYEPVLVPVVARANPRLRVLVTAPAAYAGRVGTHANVEFAPLERYEADAYSRFAPRYVHAAMQPVAWARNTLLRWLVHAARMRDAGLPPHAGVVALDGDVMVFERLALRWAALTRGQRARAGVFVFKAGYALLTVEFVTRFAAFAEEFYRQPADDLVAAIWRFGLHRPLRSALNASVRAALHPRLVHNGTAAVFADNELLEAFRRRGNWAVGARRTDCADLKFGGVVRATRLEWRPAGPDCTPVAGGEDGRPVCVVHFQGGTKPALLQAAVRAWSDCVSVRG